MNPISLEGLMKFLSGQGISLPGELVGAMMELLQEPIACMQANDVPQANINLAICYVLAMMALASNDMRISSETAPNGASRSKRFGTVGERLRSLTAMLALVDKHGCMNDLIPDNPESFKAGLWVAPGKCVE